MSELSLNKCPFVTHSAESDSKLYWAVHKTLSSISNNKAMVRADITCMYGNCIIQSGNFNKMAAKAKKLNAILDGYALEAGIKIHGFRFMPMPGYVL